MKIKVRRAKIQDVPQLVERIKDFYDIIKTKGARDLAQDESVLKGGIVIEVGNGFVNPNYYCIIAEKDGDIVAFMIGVLEFCSPVCEYLKCVRIHANYLNNDSLAGPKVLTAMWKLMEDWAEEHGAGFFYANIHPGNQPSVRAAKSIGFKHHYTQFFKLVGESEKEEEV